MPFYFKILEIFLHSLCRSAPVRRPKDILDVDSKIHLIYLMGNVEERIVFWCDQFGGGSECYWSITCLTVSPISKPSGEWRGKGLGYEGADMAETGRIDAGSGKF